MINKKRPWLFYSSPYPQEVITSEAFDPGFFGRRKAKVPLGSWDLKKDDDLLRSWMNDAQKVANEMARKAVGNMSSNLAWRPVDKNTRTFSDDIKGVLKKRYGQTLDLFLDASDIPYLRGVLDAGVSGAAEVIRAIEKYGKIQIWEEW